MLTLFATLINSVHPRENNPLFRLYKCRCSRTFKSIINSYIYLLTQTNPYQLVAIDMVHPYRIRRHTYSRCICIANLFITPNVKNRPSRTSTSPCKLSKSLKTARPRLNLSIDLSDITSECLRQLAKKKRRKYINWHKRWKA